VHYGSYWPVANYSRHEAQSKDATGAARKWIQRAWEKPEKEASLTNKNIEVEKENVTVTRQSRDTHVTPT